MKQSPPRPRSTPLLLLASWLLFYASFTLFTPALLDDADSVHVEVAREMLLRHDPVTLYANGIRYLEKAPLLYWAMAGSMQLAKTLGATSPRTLAAAARLPLALSVLALAWLAEIFARRLFRRATAGLYATLILLSSFGIFIFTRITIPDAMVCLWLAIAMYMFWLTERFDLAGRSRTHIPKAHRTCCLIFASACALNVLTKGLIGVVFPVGIATVYLLLTRGPRRTLRRIRELHPILSLALFLAIAAPWHILAGLANPGHGHPTPFQFVAGHWIVPLPTDGNVRGWFWFYFMNEHLLRYLNLRVPHDYDTVPLILFLGLCFVWLMPWSAFLPQALRWAVPLGSPRWRGQFRRHDLPLRERGRLLLAVWAAFVLLFFSFSTRQEYYVLPALPALAMLIAGWLANAQAQRQTELVHRKHFRTADEPVAAFQPSTGSLEPLPMAGTIRPVEPTQPLRTQRLVDAARTPLIVLAVVGLAFAAAASFVLLHARTPPPGTDLADLLTQHPGEYAMSFGHFLDLDVRALGMFRIPLALAAIALPCGPLAALFARRRGKPRAAALLLAAGAFLFLVAADLGLRTFAPVLSSAQLAQTIAPQIGPNDLVLIHGEYEAGSTLGFYLNRPLAYRDDETHRAGFGIGPHLAAVHPIAIFQGRSSNLWYGSFFPDAPKIFPNQAQLAQLWSGPNRVWMWQSLTDPPNQLPSLPGPVYVIARSGGKELVSNQPTLSGQNGGSRLQP
jgi:4-amino-4-deoxy-L-arabinose transferase-like glycosyltransferase